ncbi:MAG: zinc-dependent metalloprotease [Gemmatimonadales bacterium]
MRRLPVFAVVSVLAACARPAATSSQQPVPGGAAPSGAAQREGAPPPRRGPRPYRDVIPARALTDSGGIPVHRVDDKWFFELPDSLLNRDFLLVSRIAGVPARLGGFTSAGQSVAERVVRWQRQGTVLLLRTMSYEAVADDSLPIAQSVASNNQGPVLGAFPIQAFGADSATFVLDVTEFFSGDTPGIAGLSPAQRRQYQVRRLDTSRSQVTAIRSFPLNVEVRHTQTFEAGEPPFDARSGTISLEMRQSLVVLPRVAMRPRYADARVGFLTVERVNYGLEEQKAAAQRFIRRWRLEPKDPAAYARGELVEPVKPIVYYIDPATPAKWRRYVREGVEAWQRPFEAAGFRSAIIARDPPSRAEDPDWDPEDIRYSVVRWAASLVRNAVGPSTHDPRTGEIIESDITWYHNHLRSYRNRLLIETGAANPAARGLAITDEYLGNTLRMVITHEVGHAIGLPHNMVASSSIPVDSLRSPSFASRYGVSLTIMDYARQNYVAQPGDGLKPEDFIRRLGPFDDFIINWGYRALPEAPTPEAELPTLRRWITAQTGPWPYRYVPQFLSGIDPRAQTEDLSNDPVRASTLAIANLQRVMPQLVAWTTKPGEDYEDLEELYGEVLGMWGLYMGHVVTLIGGVQVDAKTADQDGAVYTVVPGARQRAALQFLRDNAFRTPAWLAPPAILSRLGPPTGQTSVLDDQTGVVRQLLDARRLDRLAASERLDPANAYALASYLTDLRRALWEVGSTELEQDAGRRALQRVYIERLGAIVAPPEQPAAAPGGGSGGGTEPPSPLLAPLTVQRGDVPALARNELQTVLTLARGAAAAAPPGVRRAHWADVAARIDRILNPR